MRFESIRNRIKDNNSLYYLIMALSNLAFERDVDLGNISFYEDDSFTQHDRQNNIYYQILTAFINQQDVMLELNSNSTLLNMGSESYVCESSIETYINVISNLEMMVYFGNLGNDIFGTNSHDYYKFDEGKFRRVYEGAVNAFNAVRTNIVREYNNLVNTARENNITTIGMSVKAFPSRRMLGYMIKHRLEVMGVKDHYSILDTINKICDFLYESARDDLPYGGYTFLRACSASYENYLKRKDNTYEQTAYDILTTGHKNTSYVDRKTGAMHDISEHMIIDSDLYAIDRDKMDLLINPKDCLIDINSANNELQNYIKIPNGKGINILNTQTNIDKKTIDKVANIYRSIANGQHYRIVYSSIYGTNSGCSSPDDDNDLGDLVKNFANMNPVTLGSNSMGLLDYINTGRTKNTGNNAIGKSGTLKAGENNLVPCGIENNVIEFQSPGNSICFCEEAVELHNRYRSELASELNLVPSQNGIFTNSVVLLEDIRSTNFDETHPPVHELTPNNGIGLCVPFTRTGKNVKFLGSMSVLNKAATAKSRLADYCEFNGKNLNNFVNEVTKGSESFNNTDYSKVSGELLSRESSKLSDELISSNRFLDTSKVRSIENQWQFRLSTIPAECFSKAETNNKPNPLSGLIIENKEGKWTNVTRGFPNRGRSWRTNLSRDTDYFSCVDIITQPLNRNSGRIFGQNVSMYPLVFKGTSKHNPNDYRLARSNSIIFENQSSQYVIIPPWLRPQNAVTTVNGKYSFSEKQNAIDYIPFESIYGINMSYNGYKTSNSIPGCHFSLPFEMGQEVSASRAKYFHMFKTKDFLNIEHLFLESVLPCIISIPDGKEFVSLQKGNHQKSKNISMVMNPYIRLGAKLTWLALKSVKDDEDEYNFNYLKSCKPVEKLLSTWDYGLLEKIELCFDFERYTRNNLKMVDIFYGQNKDWEPVERSAYALFRVISRELVRVCKFSNDLVEICLSFEETMKGLLGATNDKDCFINCCFSGDISSCLGDLEYAKKGEDLKSRCSYNTEFIIQEAVSRMESGDTGYPAYSTKIESSALICQLITDVCIDSILDIFDKKDGSEGYKVDVSKDCFWQNYKPKDSKRAELVEAGNSDSYLATEFYANNYVVGLVPGIYHYILYCINCGYNMVAEAQAEPSIDQSLTFGFISEALFTQLKPFLDIKAKNYLKYSKFMLNRNYSVEKLRQCVSELHIASGMVESTLDILDGYGIDYRVLLERFSVIMRFCNKGHKQLESFIAKTFGMYEEHLSESMELSNSGSSIITQEISEAVEKAIKSDNVSIGRFKYSSKEQLAKAVRDTGTYRSCIFEHGIAHTPNRVPFIIYTDANSGIVLHESGVFVKVNLFTKQATPLDTIKYALTSNKYPNSQASRRGRNVLLDYTDNIFIGYNNGSECLMIEDNSSLKKAEKFKSSLVASVTSLADTVNKLNSAGYSMDSLLELKDISQVGSYTDFAKNELLALENKSEEVLEIEDFTLEDMQNENSSLRVVDNSKQEISVGSGSELNSVTRELTAFVNERQAIYNAFDSFEGVNGDEIVHSICVNPSANFEELTVGFINNIKPSEFACSEIQRIYDSELSEEELHNTARKYDLGMKYESFIQKADTVTEFSSKSNIDIIYSTNFPANREVF